MIPSFRMTHYLETIKRKYSKPTVKLFDEHNLLYWRCGCSATVAKF